MIWFTALTGVVAGSTILYLIRRDRLAVHHAAWWIFAGICMLGLGLFPPLVNSFAKWIGVTYAPIVAVLIAFVALLIKVSVCSLANLRSDTSYADFVASSLTFPTPLLTVLDSAEFGTRN